MRITCKYLKRIIGDGSRGFVYKGHNAFTGQPETRLDLSKVDKDTKVETKVLLWKLGISLYQDDPLHNPSDYVVTF